MQLLEAAPQDAAADPLLVAGALATLAETADGIGPPIGRVLDAALHGLFATAAIDGLLSFRPPAQRAS